MPEHRIPEIGARIMDLQEPDAEDVDDRRHRGGHGPRPRRARRRSRRRSSAPSPTPAREIVARARQARRHATSSTSSPSPAGSTPEAVEEEMRSARGYGDLKARRRPRRSIEMLAPVRERYAELRADEAAPRGDPRRRAREGPRDGPRDAGRRARGDGRRPARGVARAVRRLALLVGAIVLVDTMFYAAITPLLPELADELDLGKNGAGVLAGVLRGRARSSARCPAAGWSRASASRRRCSLGLTLMSVSGPGLRVRLVDRRARRRALHAGRGRRVLVGGRDGLAGGRGAARAPRRGASAASLGAAIFGVQLGPVLGALATAIGREAGLLDDGALRRGAGRLGADACRRRPAARRPSPRRWRRCASARCSPGMWLTALPAAAFGVLDVARAAAPRRARRERPRPRRDVLRRRRGRGDRRARRRARQPTAAGAAPSRAPGWPRRRRRSCVLQLPDSALGRWRSSS